MASSGPLSRFAHAHHGRKLQIGAGSVTGRRHVFPPSAEMPSSLCARQGESLTYTGPCSGPPTCLSLTVALNQLRPEPSETPPHTHGGRGGGWCRPSPGPPGKTPGVTCSRSAFQPAGRCWPDAPASSSLLPRNQPLPGSPPTPATSSSVPPGGTWPLMPPKVIHPIPEAPSPDPWAPAGARSVCWQCGAHWALPVHRAAGPARRGLG